MKPSDPHLSGPRDMDYDDLIVPGTRIGPVAFGLRVTDAVRHLGNPDHINRRRYEGRPNSVYYFYKAECIGFYWNDEGVEPVIDPSAEIIVMCNKWTTSYGVHVGSTPQEA
ncbi:MAG TPA: hypothetical protein VI685_18765, partial [Candidatus Angelobacter sp.]